MQTDMEMPDFDIRTMATIKHNLGCLKKKRINDVRRCEWLAYFYEVYHDKLITPKQIVKLRDRVGFFYGAYPKILCLSHGVNIDEMVREVKFLMTKEDKEDVGKYVVPSKDTYEYWKENMF